MPAHLHVLRREQPGDPPRPDRVPRHVDQIEAREPLCFPDHARVARRHGRVGEHKRHPAPIRRPPKLAQLSGHVGEPLRRRSVERHAPQVPLPRSVRGKGEPAPVRRPGGELAGASMRRAVRGPAPSRAYTCTDVRHSLGSASSIGSDTSTAAQRPSGEIATLPTRLTANASSGVHRATGPCAQVATSSTSKCRAGTPEARLPGEWWCGCRGAAPEWVPARHSTGDPGGGRRSWLCGIDG